MLYAARGRYEQEHWFPSYQCPRHGPCWFDMFYAFSGRSEGDRQQKTLAYGLAFIVLVLVVVVIVFISSCTPAFTRAM